MVVMEYGAAMPPQKGITVTPVQVTIWYNQASMIESYKGAQLDHPMKQVDSSIWDELYTYPRTSFVDWIFEKLNINHPEGWEERSMSVGDVIQIDELFYACHPYGWNVFGG